MLIEGVVVSVLKEWKSFASKIKIMKMSEMLRIIELFGDELIVFIVAEVFYDSIDWSIELRQFFKSANPIITIIK